MMIDDHQEVLNLSKIIEEFRTTDEETEDIKKGEE